MPRLTLSLLLWVWTGIPLASALRCSPVAASLLHRGSHATTAGRLRLFVPHAVDGLDMSGATAAAQLTKRVEALLCEREDLRYERRYREADAVRDELASLGVTVWDETSYGSLADARAPRRDGGRDGLDPSSALARRRGATTFTGPISVALRAPIGLTSPTLTRATVGHAPSRGYASNEFGHDYSRSEDDESTVTALQMEQINDMLRLRLEAKLAKDYREADMLLEELGRALAST